MMNAIIIGIGLTKVLANHLLTSTDVCDEGDIGVCSKAVLGNFSCGISVI